MKHFLRGTDLPLLLLCTGAGIYGLVLVRSAAGEAVTQSISLLGGLVVALFLSAWDYHRLAARWYVGAAVVLLLMGLTFTPLGYSVPGTDDRNWLYLSLGGRTLLFQPSELLKIVFIVTFSKHLSCVADRLNRPLTLLGVALHGLLPAALVAAQGDDGNAAVFLLLFLTMLFAGGVRLRYLAAGLGLSAASIPFLWHRLTPDKQARFLCLFQIEAYRDTAGWQQDLAVTAIGSGQLWGLGYGEGGAHQLYARHNDFIFTVAGEEGGFVGAAAVLLLIWLILFRLAQLAGRSRDTLGRLIAIGLLSLIGEQALINLGMSLRLFPVLGITLPFFSAGGSSLLTLFAGVGLCLSVRRFGTQPSPLSLPTQS